MNARKYNKEKQNFKSKARTKMTSMNGKM